MTASVRIESIANCDLSPMELKALRRILSTTHHTIEDPRLDHPRLVSVLFRSEFADTPTPWLCSRREWSVPCIPPDELISVKDEYRLFLRLHIARRRMNAIAEKRTTSTIGVAIALEALWWDHVHTVALSRLVAAFTRLAKAIVGRFVRGKYGRHTRQVWDEVFSYALEGAIRGIDTYDWRNRTIPSSYIFLCVERMAERGVFRVNREIYRRPMSLDLDHSKSAPRELIAPEFGYPAIRTYEPDLELVERIAADLDTILPARQAEIIRRRCGFDGGEVETLKEIGDTIGITREGVRHFEAKALGVLRRRYDRDSRMTAV